jgi:hypothetical protein
MPGICSSFGKLPLFSPAIWLRLITVAISNLKRLLTLTPLPRAGPTEAGLARFSVIGVVPLMSLPARASSVCLRVVWVNVPFWNTFQMKPGIVVSNETALCDAVSVP